MEDFPYHLWGESLKKRNFAEKSNKVATTTKTITKTVEEKNQNPTKPVRCPSSVVR